MTHLKKALTVALLFQSLLGFSQQDSLWHLNPSTAIEAGIDWEKANTLVADRKAVPVIVAVIDGGVDIWHPDLQDNLWINPKEIAENGKDDDANGYVDDVYGWNFIGITISDSYEKTRFLKQKIDQYDTLKRAEQKNDPDYKQYKKIKKEFKKESKKMERQANFFDGMSTYVSALHIKYGDTPTLSQARSIRAKKFSGKLAKLATKLVVKRNPANFMSDIYSPFSLAAEELALTQTHHYNLELDERKKTVGDDYEDVSEKYYGDNKVGYARIEHGTHVAGIIAASSANGFGAKGVCPSCKIMSIRTVPDGDERDKDVANSIRYAVDNGAKVINMSFGKYLSPDSKTVESAVRYAQEHDVLLIHSAGNEAANSDTELSFPNDQNNTGENWIEVGASSYRSTPLRIAEFSNYSKTRVDVFAPGYEIYSTYPDSTYQTSSGTSMAGPVVAGVAAYIWSFYPMLTAKEVKDIILQSVTKIDDLQNVPGTKDKLTGAELCVSGGIVNLYAALKLAEQLHP